MESSNLDFNAVAVEDIPDEHGGIIKVITGVDISNDTVAPEFLLEGKTAHDSSGEAIVGTYKGGSTGHCVCFNVIFEPDDCFDVSFESDDCFCIDFGEFIEIPIGDFYDGEYIITPKNYEQVLETQEKAMRDDVTVLAVYYAEVDNPFGGVTVTIGN